MFLKGIFLINKMSRISILINSLKIKNDACVIKLNGLNFLGTN